MQGFVAHHILSAEIGVDKVLKGLQQLNCMFVELEIIEQTLTSFTVDWFAKTF
jgi:hypothetical protein